MWQILDLYSATPCIFEKLDTKTNHQRILCNEQSCTIVQPKSFLTEHRMLFILIHNFVCQH